MTRNMRLVGLEEGHGLEMVNARLSDKNPDYVDYLYPRLQREGYLRRDVQRLVNNDRNVFSACMLAAGDADGMVTGATRHFASALRDVGLAIDPNPGERVIGMSIVLSRGRTLFIADTSVLEFPDEHALVEIACEAAVAVERLGFTPRVAFTSYSTFGQPEGERSSKIQDAVRLLDARTVDFEYEGELAVDVALDPDHHVLYPFSRLSEPANVLVMPGAHSASIASKLLSAAGGATVIGPLLLGLSKSVQICRLGATVSDILASAASAAYQFSHFDAPAK